MGVKKRPAIYANTAPITVEAIASTDSSTEYRLEGVIRRAKERLAIGQSGLVNVAPLASTIQRMDPADLPRVITVVESEPCAVAHLMRLANTRFAGATPVTTVRGAVLQVGPQRAANLLGALAARPKQMLDYTFHQLRRIWTNTLYTAFAARALARQLSHPDPDHVFTAGMFHNIGEPILVAFLAKATGADPAALFSNLQIFRLIRDHHAEVGAIFLSANAFDARLITLAREHEGPVVDELNALVSAAHQSALRYGYGYLGVSACRERLEEATGALHLSRAHLDALPARIGDELNEALSVTR